MDGSDDGSEEEAEAEEEGGLTIHVKTAPNVTRTSRQISAL